ncbi:DNA-directed RNA polymerase subunit alpha C-terminal domain-containing protein [Bariatricus sp. HCP28S3_A7]|uniref:DNA-directed RNA polymerase subunit alpha C-terminal domain-containing protein n=1 Tax=Bariatricus sp. HCP28S3_A7 TaxID=3438894 RepID=UPI003F8BFF8E
MKIRKLTISARAKTCLLAAGYEDIEELESITDEELLNIRNLNRKGVAEIREAIDVYFASKDEQEEVLAKQKERGLSLRDQDDPFYFMTSYPDTVKNIARKKEEAWEYRLFIEAAIYKYDSLNSYRKQRVVFWDHEDYLNRIESTSEFTCFIKLQLDKLLDFVQNIARCVNVDLKESYGAPGEAGDVQKIIVATEKLMQIYKDMIAWKLSFGNIDADYKYRKVIEQFLPIIDGVLENIDDMYEKLHIAKKQFEDLLAGRITGENLHVDLNISIDLKTEDFAKALDEWKEVYFDV